eukprot:TRINITY_DN9118_c0_g1_i1.p1 TRINITY_DN9118_c0_g1~~TRINITY_DN9118_c0_g1_i1.p1  ORF type:complete len:107 (-),score=4.64 TRINITY_DN9118_c0_g1_i1:35-355(-)
MFNCHLVFYRTFYPLYLIRQQKSQLILSKVHLSRSDIKIGINSMNKVIAHYDAFKLFINHLIKSFSVENLLFLVEFVQIKHDYQKRNNLFYKYHWMMKRIKLLILV